MNVDRPYKNGVFVLVIASLSLFSQTTLAGQNLRGVQDSLRIVYSNYFETVSSFNKLDSLDRELGTIRSNYSSFRQELNENNAKIGELTTAELTTLSTRWANRRAQIIETAGFVTVAETSLSALTLLQEVTDYTNAISELNNPGNEELGFNLNDRIIQILETEIVKGRRKVNDGEADKFLAIASGIIDNPLTTLVTSSIPVVSSIKSIFDLVVGSAVRGKDISVDDITELQKSMERYVAHYERLAVAQYDFEQNLSAVNIRRQTIELLLRNFTKERIKTIDPSFAQKPKNDDLELNTIITRYYLQDDVQAELDLLVSEYDNDYGALLLDERTTYPSYGIAQARLIKDEVETIGKEYIKVYNDYQSSLSKALLQSADIGKVGNIEKKINFLDGQLLKVTSALNSAIKIERLAKEFEPLNKF